MSKQYFTSYTINNWFELFVYIFDYILNSLNGVDLDWFDRQNGFIWSWFYSMQLRLELIRVHMETIKEIRSPSISSAMSKMMELRQQMHRIFGHESYKIYKNLTSIQVNCCNLLSSRSNQLPIASFVL